LCERSLYQELITLFQDKENVILSNSIIGIADANKLTEFINNFCVLSFKSEIIDCLFAGFSVGASFGLQLKNGQKIFLKINKPDCDDSITPFSLEGLKAISQVQGYLSDYAFPCPKVILHPVEYRGVIITVNEFIDIGIQEDAHNPLIRKTMAEKFAELIKITSPCISMNDFSYINIFEKERLYPSPHNALFDFNVTGKDAGWIDEIALRSKKVINSIDKNLVLGHCDWSLKHFRFIDKKIVMIYDWDSLCIQDEYHLLGIAASTFTTTWDIPVKINPSQAEANEFVKEYEYVRQRRFTKEELRKISASATYIMAYTARCELSMDPLNKTFNGSFRQALSNMVGDNYLGIN